MLECVFNIGKPEWQKKDHTDKFQVFSDQFFKIISREAIIMLNNIKIPEISVHELKRAIDEGNTPILIDVRQTQEHQSGNIGGKLIQLDQLQARLDEIESQTGDDPNTQIVVYCRSGARSGRAVQFLLSQGYAGATNLKGGMIAWSAEIDPSLTVV